MSSSPLSFSFSTTSTSLRSPIVRSDSTTSSLWSDATVDSMASHRHSLGGDSCLTAATSIFSDAADGCTPREATQAPAQSEDEQQDLADFAAALDGLSTLDPQPTPSPSASLPFGWLRRSASKRYERRNINKSLTTSGFSPSASTPVFPLRPFSSTPSIHSSLAPTSIRTTASEPTLPSPLAPPPPLRAHSSPSTVSLASTSLTSPELSPTSHRHPSTPYRQRTRWEGDLFTPEWVRGKGASKEGWCARCGEDDAAREGAPPGGAEGEGAESEEQEARRWYRLKDASFWYHATFLHGVSSRSGRPFDLPVDFRHASTPPTTSQFVVEGLCGTCQQWKPFEVTSRANVDAAPSRTPWYTHAQTCHPNPPPPPTPTPEAA
ncbi:hypothetical protein JCM10207_005470 [Rhodosporidiobolus poonsookiae]